MDARSCFGVVHIVKEGDTLYRISRQYQVKVKDIMKYNPYIDVYNLQIGDEICVPSVAKEEVKVNKYIVKKGETLGEILEKFNKSWDDIVANNPFLKEMILPEGRTLVIDKEK